MLILLCRRYGVISHHLVDRRLKSSLPARLTSKIVNLQRFRSRSQNRERERHLLISLSLNNTLRRFSSKTERGEPWNKSETHGQNHFNSIVNVRVDSGAETLEKMIRLEAVVSYLKHIAISLLK